MSLPHGPLRLHPDQLGAVLGRGMQVLAELRSIDGDTIDRLRAETHRQRSLEPGMPKHAARRGIGNETAVISSPGSSAVL